MSEKNVQEELGELTKKVFKIFRRHNDAILNLQHKVTTLEEVDLLDIHDQDIVELKSRILKLEEKSNE